MHCYRSFFFGWESSLAVHIKKKSPCNPQYTAWLVHLLLLDWFSIELFFHCNQTMLEFSENQIEITLLRPANLHCYVLSCLNEKKTKTKNTFCICTHFNSQFLSFNTFNIFVSPIHMHFHFIACIVVIKSEE